MADSDKSDAQKKPISMHDAIPVWYDCCSCEAEPYWLAAMAQDAGKEEDKDADNGEATVAK